MKKVIIMLVLVAMVFSFTACTGDSPTKEQYQGTATQTQASKEETFGLNETAVFENLKITATDFKVSKGSDYFTPEANNVFVGVKFVIENISNEEQSVSSLLMFEGYVDDIKYSYSFSAECAFDEGTLDGSILPGKKLMGWYALEVPENWLEVELAVKADVLSNNSAVFKFEK